MTCRRSKIKCIHQGEPPCRNCLKNGRTSPTDCVLSGPDLHSTRKKKHRIPPDPQGQDGIGISPRGDSNGTEEASCVSKSKEPSAIVADVRIHDVVKATPRAEMLQAATNFRQKFPELSFLHIRISDTDANGRADLILSASIMALCSTDTDQEEYVTYVKNGLSGVLLETPKLITVQSLLILAMYEWGHGKGYSAWMATGAFP